MPFDTKRYTPSKNKFTRFKKNTKYIFEVDKS